MLMPGGIPPGFFHPESPMLTEQEARILRERKEKLAKLAEEKRRLATQQRWERILQTLQANAPIRQGGGIAR